MSLAVGETRWDIVRPCHQKEIDVARGGCRRREEVRLKEGRDTKEGIQVVSSLVIGSSGNWRKIVVYVHHQLWLYILYE